MPNRFDAGGIWHALLTLGRPRLRRSDTRDGSDLTIRQVMAARSTPIMAPPVFGLPARRAAVLSAEGFAGRTPAAVAARTEGGQRIVPYSLVVHAYSNISLEAHAEQASFEPGARIAVHATLAQSGIPLAHQAQVWAEVTPPAAGTTTLSLSEENDGQFAGQFTTSQPGVYHLRIRARGTTMSGEPFHREKTLTAAVWRGGDHTTEPSRDGQILSDYLRERDARLCELLSCFVRQDGVLSAELERRLRALGIDLDRARTCLAEFCAGKHGCE
jgi:hypothetical protein